MRHTTNTINGHRGTFDAEALVFWIFAGIIMVIAFGDALAVLAAAVAVLLAISWIYRTIARRLVRGDAAIAAVTPLRPELSGQRAVGAHSGPRAA